jgi:hypothetical protein
LKSILRRHELTTHLGLEYYDRRWSPVGERLISFDKSKKPTRKDDQPTEPSTAARKGRLDAWLFGNSLGL